MAFGAEMRDFANSFNSGVSSIANLEYARNMRQKNCDKDADPIAMSLGIQDKTTSTNCGTGLFDKIFGGGSNGGSGGSGGVTDASVATKPPTPLTGGTLAPASNTAPVNAPPAPAPAPLQAPQQGEVYARGGAVERRVPAYQGGGVAQPLPPRQRIAPAGIMAQRPPRPRTALPVARMGSGIGVTPTGNIARGYAYADGGPAQADPNDMTDQYNTPLNQQQEQQFQAFAARNPRLGNSYDYDARGAWLSGQQPDARGHGSDQFKKPNHPTFSTDSQYSTPQNPGGTWQKAPNGSYTFFAAPSNLRYQSAQDLQNYFQREEVPAGNRLALPQQTKMAPPPAQAVPVRPAPPPTARAAGNGASAFDNGGAVSNVTYTFQDGGDTDDTVYGDYDQGGGQAPPQQAVPASTAPPGTPAPTVNMISPGEPNYTPPPAQPPQQTATAQPPAQAVPTDQQPPDHAVVQPTAPPSHAANPGVTPHPETNSAAGDGAGAMPVRNADGTTDDGRTWLGRILHNSIMYLQDEFGLNQAVPGGGPNRAGQAALMGGQRAASWQDVQAALHAVDPGQRLPMELRVIKALRDGVDWYEMHGDVAKANAYAASLIQFTNQHAAAYGQDALEALHNGDVQGAATLAARGASWVLNGEHPANIKMNPDGKTGTVDQVNTVTGQKIATHTFGAEDLYNASLGLANGSLQWQKLLEAASTVKDAAVQAPQSVIDATNRLLGTDQAGGTAGGTAPPAGGGAAAGAAPTGFKVTIAKPTITDVPDDAPGNVAAVFSGDLIPTDMRQFALNMAQGESTFNPTARNGQSLGLFQFQPDTWEKVTGQKIDPKVIGTEQDPRFNPELATRAFVKLTQMNAADFQKKVGRAPTPGELAIAHQQGVGVAEALANAKPGDSAVAVMAPILKGGADTAKKHLVANKIPANATVQQAIDAISGHYGLKGGGGTVNLPAQVSGGAGAASAIPGPEAPAPGTPAVPGAPPAPTASGYDPMKVVGRASGTDIHAPLLPEDAEERPPIPQKFVPKGLTGDDVAGLTASQVATLAAELKARNAAGEKQYQDDVKDYNLKLAAWKAAHTTKQASMTQTQGYEKGLDEVIGEPRSDTTGKRAPSGIDKIFTDDKGVSNWDDYSPAQQDAVKDIALDIGLNNPETTATKALQHTHLLIGASTPGEKQRYSIHDIPGSDRYRVYSYADGEMFTISKAMLGEAMLSRGSLTGAYRDRANKAAAAAAKPSLAATGARAVGATGTGVGSTVAGTARALAAPRAAITARLKGKPIPAAAIEAAGSLRSLGGPSAQPTQYALPTWPDITTALTGPGGPRPRTFAPAP